MESTLNYEGVGSQLEMFMDFEDQASGLQKAQLSVKGLQTCPGTISEESFQSCKILENSVVQKALESTSR